MEPETAESSPRSPAILVATDFSETAGVAIDWAIELARQQGARLELVHAVTIPPSVPGPLSAPGPLGVPGPLASPGPTLDEQVRQAARERLDEAAAALHERGIAVETFLGIGTPSQVILERARAAATAAIVVGTRGLSGLRHVLLGSTAQRVVQGASCPVLSVHPEDRERHRPIRSILVPTDFSHDAEVAIRTAHQLLASMEQDARLILIHAFNLPIEYTAYGPIPTSVHYLRDTGLEAERRLAEAAEGLAREGLTVETVAREGDPAGVVADEARARDVDLIAMGTHGRSGLRHLLLGSTAERVVQHSPCPVLTIRRASDKT